MTEWIDVLVYATFMFVLWFALPAVNARFVVPVIEDRHPGWLAARPDVAHRVAGSRRFRLLATVLGLGSIGLLGAAQTPVWPGALAAPRFEREHWMVLSDLFTALTLVWLITFATASALFHRWLHREVPLADRRTATLEPRSLAAVVARPLRVAVFTVVGLHLAAWIAVGIWNGDTSAPFWGMAASQFLIGGILLWIAFGISRRRPHALDRIFGPAYRRSEMHFAMVAQIFPVLNGGMRLYEQAVGSVQMNLDRASRLGLVVFMLVGVAVCLFRFTWSSGSRLDRAAAQRAWAIVFLLGMTAALSLGELEGRRTAQLRGANCTAAAAAAGGTM